MVSISIILPTCGRPTLRRAIDSAIRQLRPNDEVLVIGDGCQPAAQRIAKSPACEQVSYSEHGPTGFLGNAQRNAAQKRARGDILMFLDHADYLAPDALSVVRAAAEKFPGRPLMFRIQFHDPPFLKWTDPVFANENISGASFVVPRIPEYLGEWPEPSHPLSHWSDRVFIEDTLKRWPGGIDSLLWRPEIIYHVPEASCNAP